MVLPLLFLCFQPAPAQEPASVFDDAVGLIDQLYLRPTEVVPERLLHKAAQRLSDRIHWLMVERIEGGVALAHGDGTPLGTVRVARMDDLPDALEALGERVRGAGHPLGEVDVELALLQGLTDALDRYSRVLADDAKARFDVRLKGTLVGIGATLQWREDALRVVEVVVGGPADLGGVRPGDVIERIDGRSVVSMPVSEASRRLRGRSGTQTVLSLRREGRPLTVALTRAQVIVKNVEHRVLDGSVAYIRIENMSQKTVHNTIAAMTELEAMGALSKGLVLDLRGNTGGSMKESARTADLFLDEGLLLRTVGRDGGRVQNLQERMEATPGGQGIDLPVVVLVDDRTASGAEILAGALRELGRVVLVGERTYGKGSVQKLYPLGPATDLKLTVAQYLLADDVAIDHLGLVPDAAIGRVEITGQGVHFHDFDEGWQRTRWEDILPWVQREGDGSGIADLPLEIARRTVIASAAPTRRAGLEALERVVAELRVEEEGRLAAAMEQLGVDWTPAPDEGTFLDAEVSVRAEPWEGRPDVVRVRAEVRNRADEPMYRALVQLHCPSLAAWDEVVIPVGRVAAGGRGRGEVAVALEPGIGPREDVVDVRLRADRRAPLAVGQVVLAARSRPEPTIRLAARLVPAGAQTRRAEVTVINDADHALEDVVVRFGWPGDLDVELLDQAVRIPVVPARDRFRADLELRPGPTAPAVLPLRVRVETERYGVLARWPLALPMDGRTVTLAAPRVVLGRTQPAAPVGGLDLPLVVSDDREIDYVVVYAHGQKVAWSPGGRGRIRFVPHLELAPGVNHVYVEVGDSDGIRTLGTFAIRGEEPVAVDAAAAGESEEP